MRYLKMLLSIYVIFSGMTVFAADMPASAGPGQGGTGKDPFMERLEAFVEKDGANPPLENSVLFTGSSMFEGWTDVADHMSPIPAFNRAIGGSKTGDILKYVDQLILKYKPKVVVLYSGINDVSEGVSPATAAENIRKIVKAINAGLPGTQVIYVAILNTSNRPDSAELINEANALIKAYAGENSTMTYLDVSASLVDEKGATRDEFLTEDKSHYNSAAYEAMAAMVRPAVQKAWSR